MLIRFWGVRGSVPAPLSNDALAAKAKDLLISGVKMGIRTEEEVEGFMEKLPPEGYGTYGGNTACITVHDNDKFIVLDAGTGLRVFGLYLMRQGWDIAKPIHILLTHFHWDHIIGFPFFRPAFEEGTRIVVHTPSEQGREYFEVQQSSPFSPAEFAFLSAKISFQVSSDLQDAPIAGFRVSSVQLNHPGGSMAYRVTSGDSSVVYMTDTELANTSVHEKRAYQEFARGCDVAIIDAMYGMLESYEKLYWGHSASFPFIDLLRNCGIKTLVLFHHDPDSDDDRINEGLNRAHRYYRHVYPAGKMQIICAREGMTLGIPRKDN